MRKALLFFVLLCLMLTACKEKAYHSQLKLLYKHSVPLITADSLAGHLAGEDPLLVLDSRSPAEWQVSRLAGARLVDYEGFTPKVLQDISPQQPLAVYCTIGYRSEKIAQQLKEAGFKQVYNLFGGIIEWKNKGYAVVDSAGIPTDRVHTYDRYWGIYLTNGKQVHEK